MTRDKELDLNEDEENDPQNELLREKIIEIRNSMRLTQKIIAERMGVKQSAISKMFSPGYKFKLRNIVALAEALEVNPHVLLAIYIGENNPNKYNSKEKEVIEKIWDIIVSYRHEGLPPNVPDSPNESVHPSQLNEDALSAPDRIKAQLKKEKNQNPIANPIENKES